MTVSLVMLFLDYGYKNKVGIAWRYIEYIVDHYDGAIAYADKYIGGFLKTVDELNLRNNTIIILTSYHVTALFEHGIILRRQHGGGTDQSIKVIPSWTLKLKKS